MVIFLIANNSKDYKFSKGESILNIDPDLIDNDISLSNTKFKISIRDDLGDISDVAGDGGAPFFGDYNLQIASMVRLDYLSDGGLFSSWAATEQISNLDEGIKDLATPENSGRPIIKNITLNPIGYKIGTSLQVDLEYEIFDSRDDLDHIEINTLGNLIKATLDDKHFDLGYFETCPIITISFLDKTGLSGVATEKLNCFEPIGNVKLNEVLFRPKQVDWNSDGKLDLKDEWIELKNFDPIDHDLTGFKIRDRSGKEFVITGKILANSFMVLSGLETGLSLNDDGEELYIIDPNNETIDRLNILKSDMYDIAYAAFEDGWRFTKKVTLLSENIFETIDESPKLAEVSSPHDSSIAQSSNEIILTTEPEAKSEIIYAVYETTVSKPALTLPDIQLDEISISEVKGSQAKSGLNPSKRTSFVLYFFSVLVFISLIFIYEFYRRE